MSITVSPPNVKCICMISAVSKQLQAGTCTATVRGCLVRVRVSTGIQVTQDQPAVITQNGAIWAFSKESLNLLIRTNEVLQFCLET